VERYNSSQSAVEKENAMHKRWVKASAAAAALVIVVVGLIPLFVNADTFRPTIENQLTTSLGRKVTLGHLSLSLFTGSLVAQDISIADDSSLSNSPFLQAKELRIGIELGELLFHHSVQMTDLTVDSASIHLIHAQNGTWNFSSMGSAAAQPASSQSGSVPALTVSELKIKNGSGTVSSLPAAGNPIACSDINLTVHQFSFATSFPFELSATIPGDGSIKISGTAGPISQKDASQTPFQATLEIKHFDPVAAGVVQPGDGISMLADFDAQVTSDSGNLQSTGKIVASRLQLARNGSPSPQPVNIDYTVSDNLGSRTGQVSDLAIHTGTVAVHLNGGYNATGQDAVLDLHLSAPNLPIDQLEQLLPAAGVRLPTGSRLSGGTLTASLAITGPANAITIAGPVEIDNTQLAGFDLGSRIQGLNPFAGTKNGTQIEKLSTTLNSSPQSTQFSSIYASIPMIGTASGTGSVSPGGALDFQLTAKLSATSAVGGLASTGINAVGGLLGAPKATLTDEGIPLTITGTTSDPSIKANVGAMLKQTAGGLLGNSSGQQKSNPIKSVKGLFGK
jgi:AsmA protein